MPNVVSARNPVDLPTPQSMVNGSTPVIDQNAHDSPSASVLNRNREPRHPDRAVEEAVEEAVDFADRIMI